MKLTRIQSPIDLKKLIEDRLTEYDIYRYYIGQEIKLNTMMRSPLHKDKHPSFSIGASTLGRLVWRDYAMDEKGGWTDMVMKMFNLTYIQVLEKVAKDWGLMEGEDKSKRIQSEYTQPVIEAKKTLIQVTTKKFTSEDIKWWGQYLISTDDLKKEEVYSVENYYINRIKQPLKPGEKVYCYYYGEHGMKIYHPDRTRDEGRWKSSIPCSYVENLQNINSDKVLVTKSKKDRVTLAKILPYTCINVQNEGTSGYTEETRQILQGKEVIIMYDNDEAGVRNCKKICDTWGYRYVNVPKHMLEHKVKDASDWVSYAKGYDPLIEHLKIKNVI